MHVTWSDDEFSNFKNVFYTHALLFVCDIEIKLHNSLSERVIFSNKNGVNTYILE
jgi:hypothetical protein